MKTFIRPLENLLINLKHVSHIERDRTTIRFVMNAQRLWVFAGSGGQDPVIHKIVYPTEDVAWQKFEDYAETLNKLR